MFEIVIIRLLSHIRRKCLNNLLVGHPIISAYISWCHYSRTGATSLTSRFHNKTLTYKYITINETGPRALEEIDMALEESFVACA